MSINQLPVDWNHPGVTLRSMRLPNGVKEAFNLVPTLEGKDLEFTSDLRPHLLTLAAAMGKIELCYEDLDVLRVRGGGLGMRMVSIQGKKATVFQTGERSWQAMCGNGTMYKITVLEGDVEVDFVHQVRAQDTKRPQEQIKRPWISVNWSASWP